MRQDYELWLRMHQCTDNLIPLNRSTGLLHQCPGHLIPLNKYSSHLHQYQDHLTHPNQCPDLLPLSIDLPQYINHLLP